MQKYARSLKSVNVTLQNFAANFSTKFRIRKTSRFGHTWQTYRHKNVAVVKPYTGLTPNFQGERGSAS